MRTRRRKRSSCDEERLGQRDRLSVEGDLTLVHRLEKRRLRSRAGAVDLVREEDVGEDGALSQDELALALVVDADAEDVAREEIARELHAPQIAADRLGESASQRGLAHTGDVLDEQVSARQQRHQRELDRLVLAFQRGLDCLPQRLELGKLLGDARRGCRHSAQSSTTPRRRTAARDAAGTLMCEGTVAWSRQRSVALRKPSKDHAGETQWPPSSSSAT